MNDGTNWYVYCSNNPLCFVDPTGLEDENIIEDSPAPAEEATETAQGTAGKDFIDEKVDEEENDAFKKVTESIYTEEFNEDGTITTTHKETTIFQIKETQAGKEYAANLNKEADIGKTLLLGLGASLIPGVGLGTKVVAFGIGMASPYIGTAIYEDGSTIIRENIMKVTANPSSLMPPKTEMQSSLRIYDRPREGNSRQLVFRNDFNYND